jgi:hypothetical protein
MRVLPREGLEGRASNASGVRGANRVSGLERQRNPGKPDGAVRAGTPKIFVEKRPGSEPVYPCYKSGSGIEETTIFCYSLPSSTI